MLSQEAAQARYVRTMRLVTQIATLIVLLHSMINCSGEDDRGPYVISAIDHKDSPFVSIEFRDSTGAFAHELIYQNTRDTLATTDSTYTIHIVNHFVKNTRLLAVHNLVDQTVVRSKKWDPHNPHTIKAYKSELNLFNNMGDSIWSFVHSEKIDNPLLRGDIQFVYPRFTERDDLLFVLARSSKDIENGFIKIIDETGVERLFVSEINDNPIHTPMMPHLSRDGNSCILQATDEENAGQGQSHAMLVDLATFNTYAWGQRTSFARFKNDSTVVLHSSEPDTVYNFDVKELLTF